MSEITQRLEFRSGLFPLGPWSVIMVWARMALRLYASVLRNPARLSGGVCVPCAHETGGAAVRPSVRFLPARFASEALLGRVLKNTETGRHGPQNRCSAAGLSDSVFFSGKHKSSLVNDPDQPENSKILKVAIIGAPNAGKSTLSNQLVGKKVFAVSKKVHTTRSQAQGIFTEDDTQIVVLDTPGLINASKVKRHQLERSLLVDPWISVREADLVLVVVDVSDRWTRNKLGFEVLSCLAQNQHIPAALVLNKVDLLKNKSMLLDITVELTEGIVNGKKLEVRSAVQRFCEWESGDVEVGVTSPCPRVPGVKSGTAFASPAALPNEGLCKEDLRKLRDKQGWPCFQDVFMLSAIDSEEVETLKRYLVVGAKPGPWKYHSGVLTDQSPEEICTSAVRERLLEYLPQEVPYNVSQKMLIGQGGHMIGRIAREAGQDLMNVFRCEVKLKLSVKMKK
ncbi:GTPase Era, mitochondrial isoform X2 [Scleropages formosus]|uniref:GTPase Era, mitochondrial n=1 Tax=Scleropages formosus TaxID=113540 RepID=A0A8C9TNJ3_SCLFO|nr:GTPase Era, mitochondrial isoform X2 [Scleropages formosus]